MRRSADFSKRGWVQLPGLAAGLALGCSLLAGPACAQSLALSFDDGFNPHDSTQAAAWNAEILRALADGHVQAILYPAGRNVDSPEGLALVKDWGLAGHAIGNHTYNHRSLGAREMTLPLFIADVERNQALLAALPGWTSRLRFPYLKEGDTAAKRDGMRAWLAAHAYGSGAVSIDASDWYYDERYGHGWGGIPVPSHGRSVRPTSPTYGTARSTTTGLSQRLLGAARNMCLLLHTRRINAEFLPDIIAMFRARGWTIISPAEAYTDPLYARQPTTLPAGESILWSLAKQVEVQRPALPGRGRHLRKAHPRCARPLAG